MAALLAGAVPVARSLWPPRVGAGSSAGREETGPRQAILQRAAAEEKRRDFAAAGRSYAAALEADPERLVRVLWDLQTKAADAGRPADTIPLLEQLDALYAGSTAPRIEGLGRWDVVNSLAWYLATVPGADRTSGRRARELAEEGLRLAGADRRSRAESLDTLAAACARAGDWDEAIRRIDEAIGLGADPDERALFESHRALYESRRTLDAS